jgi:hypothetical protein
MYTILKPLCLWVSRFFPGGIASLIMLFKELNMTIFRSSLLLEALLLKSLFQKDILYSRVIEMPLPCIAALIVPLNVRALIQAQSELPARPSQEAWIQA